MRGLGSQGAHAGAHSISLGGCLKPAEQNLCWGFHVVYSPQFARSGAASMCSRLPERAGSPAQWSCVWPVLQRVHPHDINNICRACCCLPSCSFARAAWCVVAAWLGRSLWSVLPASLYESSRISVAGHSTDVGPDVTLSIHPMDCMRGGHCAALCLMLQSGPTGACSQSQLSLHACEGPPELWRISAPARSYALQSGRPCAVAA